MSKSDEKRPSLGLDLDAAPDRTSAEALLQDAITRLWDEGPAAVAHEFCGAMVDLIQKRDDNWTQVCYRERMKERMEFHDDIAAVVAIYEKTGQTMTSIETLEVLLDRIKAKKDAPPYGPPEDATIN